MIGRLFELVIDCPEPAALAAFYRELTGLEELYSSPDWVTLGRGDHVRIAFQLAQDHRPPQWPDSAHPQQMHLDVVVDDLERGQESVLKLGARLLVADKGADFRVFADPAGHPFCLCLTSSDAP